MTSPRRSAVLACAAATFAVACSPTLDWRESRPENSGAALLFPCRPAKIERSVVLAGERLRMQLHSCAAGGATYSLAFADVGAAGPKAVTRALAAWRSQTATNVAGRATASPLRPVTGATPDPAAGFDRIDGRLPDGRPVALHAAFFVRGERLYQAAIVGAGDPADQEALDNFFGNIRLR